MGRTQHAISRAEKLHRKNFIEQDNLFESVWLPKSIRKQTQHVPAQISNLTLKLMKRYAQVKTLLVTGCDHGDGATTTTLNLATTLSGEFDHQVLLVDANIRSPDLADILKAGKTRGFTEMLQNRRLDWLNFKRVGPGDLYLLPGGAGKCDGANCFCSPEFIRFIQAARHRFEYVILDVAPVSEYSDALAIASNVDGVIIVMTHGKTRRQAAAQIAAEFRHTGANLLGVVVNRRKYPIPQFLLRWL